LPAVVESTITGADLTQLLKILLPESDVAVNGRVSGTLKLSGNLMTENDQGEETLSFRGLVGTATFTELSINVGEITLSAAGPLVVDLAPNEINFHEARFTGTGSNVTLGGTVATNAGGRNTLSVNGDINLRILTLFSKDVFSTGIAVLAINVGGAYENPRVTGRASISGASVSLLLGDQRLTLSNLNGAILFNARQAQIERLEGTLGGGKVTVTGGAQLAGFALSQFLFNAHGENVTLNYPED